MNETLLDLSPDFRAALEKHADRLDLELIDRALRFGAGAHRGQKRMSGEDFISHSIAVATILIGQFVDSTSIAAALLHDVVEDSDVRGEDITAEFGPEVAGLVDGLTKISHLTFRSTPEEQVENYRKLLLSIAKDARVIIIKLADRLHNMRTLEPLPPEKRARIATETREIYAPLAHRFGMAGVKAELEDLAFKFLEPEEYALLARQVAAKRVEREAMIASLQGAAGKGAGPRRLERARRQRPPQASLVHLAEDAQAEHAVRGDLRHDGPAGDRGVGARLLSRAGHHPSPLAAAAGALQGLHRVAQVQRLPVASHHDLRAERASLRNPDPHGRDAPDGRVRYRGALALQDRAAPSG